jgi:hypothetical protein
VTSSEGVGIEEFAESIFPDYPVQTRNIESDVSELAIKLVPSASEVFISLKGIIKNLSNEKAPGPSGVCYEVFKNFTEPLYGWLADFFRKCRSLQTVPKSWGNGITVGIAKPGGGYRPITLLESGRKIFEAWILKDISASAILHRNQGGFRPGMGTYQQVINLECTMKALRCKNLTVAFLDVKKAYDNVNRQRLWSKLVEQQPAITELKLLKSLFEDNTVAVTRNGQLSQERAVVKGLAQGSKLSPILFNIFFNDFVDSCYTNVGNRGMEVLLYADDVVIVAKSKRNMRSTLKKAQEHSRMNAYSFNVKKSVIMCNYAHDFCINRVRLPSVESFKYLGVFFTMKGPDMKMQLNANFNSARKSLFGFKFLCGNGYQGLTLVNKLGLYKSFIKPRLEYGMLFGATKLVHIKRLQIKENTLIKALLRLGRNSSTKKLAFFCGNELQVERQMRMARNAVSANGELLRHHVSTCSSLRDARKNKFLAGVLRASSNSLKNPSKKTNLALNAPFGPNYKGPDLLKKIGRLGDGYQLLLMYMLGSLHKKTTINNVVFFERLKLAEPLEITIERISRGDGKKVLKDLRLVHNEELARRQLQDLSFQVN